jgi:mRNA interferase HigB
VQIVNTDELLEFSTKHPNARRALDKWQKIVSRVIWTNFMEVRATFRSADYVKGLVIFNIGGNNYRLIATIVYNRQQVQILEIMTHRDYNRWKP